MNKYEKKFNTINQARFARILIEYPTQGEELAVRLPEIEIYGSNIEKTASGYRNVAINGTIVETSGFINESESTSLFLDG